MTLRSCPLALGLVVWGLGIAVAADPATSPEIEPSLVVYERLDARAQLTDAQRAFFGPYFASHAARLRDMRVRLNAGELSYVGAIFEGRALERELSAEAVARLDAEQQVMLGEIRDGLRSEFRALFFKEEHSWLLRMFGRRDATPTPSDTVEAANDEKS